MYIPVFEIKDSFIVKHKLQYNTSCDLDLPFKMMFMDYDLARKSQTTNAENFSGITMGVDLSIVPSINMSYFDESYTIYLDGDLVVEDEFNSGNTTNSSDYQEYTVPDGSLFGTVTERVSVDIYQKQSESGTTSWEHYAYIPNDVWVKSGSTSFGSQWIITGSTTSTGYTSGYTNWYVEDITPVLTYIAYVLETGSTYIRLEKKLEDYLLNNLLNNYDDLYYQITSINHCNPNYPDLYLKLLLFPIEPNFDIILNSNSITINPKFNNDDIYFNYDALDIELSGVTGYTFETTCLYNKYNLTDFFGGIGYGPNGAIHESYITNTITLSGYTYGDYYMTMEIPDTDDLIEYTYVELETATGNTYNVMITEITGTIITVISPFNYASGETIVTLTNLNKIGQISDVLQKTYENYNQGEYRKHTIQIQKKVYNAYAEIINLQNDNQELRLKITGLIFENDNKIMVLKVFDPADFIDDRLLYEPIEIVRIGKDRKTSIPITIKEFEKGISADEIDANVYSVYLFDPRIYDVLIINANAT